MSMPTESSPEVCRRRPNAACILLCAVSGLLLFAVATPAVAQTRIDDPEQFEGRIWNASSQPFSYQLRRSQGRTWTRVFTLPPGEYHSYKAPIFGGRDDLEGLSRTHARLFRGHLTVQFPALGGMRRMRIKAVDLQNDVIPFWFYVIDVNGDGQLIQASSLHRAREIQDQLQQQTPKTPAELERWKARLRANHALYLR